MKEKMKKKNVLLLVLLLLLVTVAMGGTIAWLTQVSTVTNSFTVGSFENPTTSPTDPSVAISLEGNLYEPSWDKNAEHKLLPGVTYAKDPYVGIGKGSEDAVVYVYVDNTLSNKVYFTLNAGWEAVTDETTAGSKAGTYTSGLFKYTAGLTGAATADVWTTTPLFSEVVTDDTAGITDFTPASGDEPQIVVSSLVHQAKDGAGNKIDDATILSAAKEAFGIQ